MSAREGFFLPIFIMNIFIKRVLGFLGMSFSCYIMIHCPDISPCLFCAISERLHLQVPLSEQYSSYVCKHLFVNCLQTREICLKNKFHLYFTWMSERRRYLYVMCVLNTSFLRLYRYMDVFHYFLCKSDNQNSSQNFIVSSDNVLKTLNTIE